MYRTDQLCRGIASQLEVHSNLTLRAPVLSDSHSFRDQDQAHVRSAFNALEEYCEGSFLKCFLSF